jgi:polyhydroxyalkanoate synthase
MTTPTNRDDAAVAAGGAFVGRVSAPALVADALWSMWRRADLPKLTARLARDWASVTTGTSTIAPDSGDRRFTDPAWQENPGYRRLMQAYLAWDRAVTEAIEAAADPSEDWRVAERARLGARILTSAMAPTNSPFTNPAVAKRAFDTAGASLLRGARNFVDDLLHNGGAPKQVERDRFVVGRDVAATPGAVVYRTELFELLQYTPTTPKVHRVPLLVVPPVINRYYFVDISPGRSFVEYAISQGFTTFLISWRHPRPGDGRLGLDDYAAAVLDALEAATDIDGSFEAHVFGVCTGGVVAGAALSHQVARGGPDRARSLGLSVCMLTYDEPSNVGMGTDRAVVDHMRRRAAAGRIVPAREIESSFGWLKPDDLVWSFVVNDWLLGNDPPGGDVMAWSSDPAAAPAGLVADLLEISLHDSLRTPGAVTVLDTPVDLGKLGQDTFAVAGATDHISPWKACYTATQLLGGDVTFALTNTAHAATMVSPPGHRRARYFVGGDPGPDPDAWLAGATEAEGSWWPAYIEWLMQRSDGPRSAPRRLGSARHPVLDDAPGRYVHER